MRLPSVVALIAPLLVAVPAGAAEPDPALALLTGAATQVAGFIVGGTLLVTNHGHDEQANAGWLTVEGGFTLAPFAAHAVVGEWGRGAVFAALPAGALGGTAALFGVVPGVVESGTLEQQRVMWALFVGGLFASGAGVVDAVLVSARARRVTVAPTIGSGRVGLQIGGTL
jgi:hypothetical protein